MKKINYLKLAAGITPIAALAMGVGSVYAASDENITTAEALKACLTQEGDATCTLGADIVLDEWNYISQNKISSVYTTNSGSKILDLNDQKITVAADKHYTGGMIRVDAGGKLTIKGGPQKSGTITTNESEVTSSTPESGQTYAAVQTSSNSELIIESGNFIGFYYGLAGNGQDTNAKITVNGGTLSGLRPDDSYGIYHPQTELLTINGGTITGGACGIELRGGTLKVNGGEISSSASRFFTQKNNNGTTTGGAAIAVVQHTSNLPINLEVTNGSIIAPRIEGGYALFEADTQGISTDKGGARSPINFSFTGGNFAGLVNATEAATETPFIGNFIKGGTYNDPSAKKYLVTSNNPNYRYEAIDAGVGFNVKTTYQLTVENLTHGTLNIADGYHSAGETVTIITTPDNGYKLSKLEYSVAENNYVNIDIASDGKTGSFVMPDFAITIRATFTQETQSNPNSPTNPGTTPSNPTNPENPGTTEDPENPSNTETPENTETPNDTASTLPEAVSDKSSAEEILKETLLSLILADPSLAAQLEGAESINASITIDDNIDAQVPESVKTAMKNAATRFYDGMTVTNFFEILIDILADGVDVGDIHELTKPISFTVGIPSDLPELKPGYNRMYRIIRMHNGVADILYAKENEDNQTLTFESDKFSTYAIAYVDVVKNTTVELPTENITETPTKNPLANVEVANASGLLKSNKSTSAGTAILIAGLSAIAAGIIATIVKIFKKYDL